MLMSNDSVLTYCEALDQAICDQMHFDSTIFVYGVETNMFGSLDKVKRQHKARVITTPISEDALAGFGFGSAITGLRPVFVHIRSEFFTLCMNQIVNVVSSHSYSTLGESSVPLFIRVVIGRGWGQGYQHSKSLMSVFAHIPGLIVTAPTTPSDAWNMTKASLTSRNPVIQFEHRWLYWQKGEIEAEADPIGKSKHRRKGTDVTIVAISWMNVEAIQAADFLKEYGISCDIIDPRTLTNIDYSLITESVDNTGVCLVLDLGWPEYGLGSQIAASIYERCFAKLKKPIKVLAWENTPCPTAKVLEREFYPNVHDIVNSVYELLGIKDKPDRAIKSLDSYSHQNRFKGPF